ncbi:endoplasmic oxidoreductin [Dentipellis sp. KUC8613]|nr:endoplasmic oxidoreductin [Dentipellis sp. KUC8613]
MRPRLLPSALLFLLLDWPTPNSWISQAYAADNSFLGDTLVRKDQVQSVLEHEPAQQASCENMSNTGPIETTLCNYEMIESVNDDLFKNLKDIVQTPFFRYFRVDLYRECPFWEENVLCMSKDCQVVTVDESAIPEKWRSNALGKLEIPSDEQRESIPGCYYRDSDFCFLDDETEGDYVDLALNPERFTGYAGISTQRIWKAIYEENCFGQSELSLMNNPASAEVHLPDTMADILRADGDSADGQCIEKRVYYKVISGLHASISTHICQEYLNQTTGEWGPNLQCFVTRVASHPERLQYIYFNTVLLLRAVSRIGPYLSAYDYCASGTHDEHDDSLQMLGNIITHAENVGKFDESVLFRGENANVLKQEFKQHFRNVTRIMDCVACDKCRLWGKVQTTGLGVALKILFELDEQALDPKLNSNLLSRAEVVALINTLYRFSESLKAVDEFRHLWRETSDADSDELIREANRAVAGWPRPSPAVGDDYPPPTNFVEQIQRRLAPLMRACKESTVGCVGIVMQILERVTSAFSSLFGQSGKDQGPRAEL